MLVTEAGQRLPLMNLHLRHWNFSYRSFSRLPLLLTADVFPVGDLFLVVVLFEGHFLFLVRGAWRRTATLVEQVKCLANNVIVSL